MPISTPERSRSTYGGDEKHFEHVLEFLFKPAAKVLGYELIPPSAYGADVIHGEIIRNLESADLVLCDMSLLNPNVFFELGIRTALNRTVCMVKDDATPSVPFDTSIVNFHTYLSELTPWTLNSEIERLSAHMKKSIERSEGKNTLWKYFGISTIATPPTEDESKGAVLELMTRRLDGLNRKLDMALDGSKPARPKEKSKSSEERFFDDAIRITSSHGFPVTEAHFGGGVVTLMVDAEKVSDEIRSSLNSLADQHGIDLIIEHRSERKKNG